MTGEWVPGYLPSNGTDGEIFRAGPTGCASCLRDHPGWHEEPHFEGATTCPIALYALTAYPDAGPRQWESRTLENGRWETRCTAWLGPCPCPDESPSWDWSPPDEPVSGELRIGPERSDIWAVPKGLCSGCGQPVVWARTPESSRPFPVTAHPANPSRPIASRSGRLVLEDRHRPPFRHEVENVSLLVLTVAGPPDPPDALLLFGEPDHRPRFSPHTRESCEFYQGIDR